MLLEEAAGYKVQMSSNEKLDKKFTEVQKRLLDRKLGCLPDRTSKQLDCKVIDDKKVWLKM